MSAKSALDSVSALPVVVEQVTVAWLSTILGKTVKTANLVEGIHGTASKLLYHVTYENVEDAASLPSRICVKGGFNPELLKLHPSLMAIFRHEARFYHSIAPTLDMRLPTAWFTGTDTVTGQGIVVLDDLKARDYTFGDPLQTWPVSCVRSGVEQLAKLHGKSWGAKNEDPSWLGDGLYMRSFIIELLQPPNWNLRFLDETVKPPVPESLLDRERIIRAFKNLWATSNPTMDCVTHGDPHIGNTFITPTGEPGFLDWQCFHVNNALQDVTYFVVGALTVEERREHEVDILEHYLTALHKAGGPKLEKDEVSEDYKKCLFHGLCWALTPPLMQPKDKVDAMTERYCAAIVDHGSLELLEGLPGYVREA